MPQELERKYALADEAAFTDFVQATTLGGFELQPPRTVFTEDVYLDTRTFRLLRHGQSLRLRRLDKSTLITLKSMPAESSGPVLARLELEAPAPVPFSLEHMEWLPAVIREHLADTGDLPGQVKPYLVLRQTRIKRMGLNERGEIVLEMSLDHVAVYGAGQSEPLGEFFEVEFEAMGQGDLNTLYCLIDEPLLCELASLTTSKLQHALRLWGGLGPDSGAGFGPASTVLDALRAIWRKTLVELLLSEAAIRTDSDMEWVHRSRVALRGARTAARMLGPWLDTGANQAGIAKLQKRMQRLARKLGRVRDNDVMLANLEKYRTQRLAAGAAVNQIDVRLEEVHAQREAAFTALIAGLEGRRHRALIHELAEFCRLYPSTESTRAASGCGKQRGPYAQVRHVFPQVLIELFSEVRAYEQHGDKLATLKAGRLHALRIACKRLRYMIEFALPLLGPQMARVLGRLRKLQELLGEINDAYVELDRLEKGHKKLYKKRRDAVQKSLRRLRRKVPHRFADVVKPVNRKRFMLALAKL